MKRSLWKNPIRIVPAFLAAALLSCCLSSCATDTNSLLSMPDDSTDYTAYDSELTDEIKATEGLYKAAENQSLCLYVSGKTAEAVVEDKATGQRWYTNPADRDKDELATGGFKDELDSQFMIQYINSSEKVFNMNSAKDAVAYDQITFVKLENGIRINYIFGKAKKVYLVPYVVEASRFEELLSGLDEMDAAMLSIYYSRISLETLEDEADKALYRQRYPVLDKHDIYCITNVEIGEELPDMMLEDIEFYFKKCGYTAQDLANDNKENGVPSAENEDITIGLSVEYRLEGSTLITKVPVNSIRHDESKIHLTQLTCLPYFGAAGTDKDGYIFVPDGCGAVINLNSGKKNIERYSSQIYGEDPTLQEKQLDKVDKSRIYMPVFGIKQDDSAFLTVAEGAAPYMKLNADVSGKNNSYNFIYADVILKESNMQTDAVMNMAGTHIYQKVLINEDISFNTLFLSGAEANYTGMAKAYRKYLVDKGDLPDHALTNDGVSLHFTAVGAVSYKTTRLGVPITAQKKLTGYTEIKTMMEQLKSDGADRLSVNYSSWCNGGADSGAPNNAKLVSALGSKQDFRELSEYVSSAGIDFYSDIDFTFVSGYKKGYNINKDSSRALSNVPAFYSDYNPATLETNRDIRRAIVSPKEYGRMVDGFLKAYQKLDLKGVSLPEFGNTLVSDFNQKQYVLRGQALELVREQLGKISEEGYRVALHEANLYAVKNASLLVSVPDCSSGNFMFDYDVPFYQTVVSGLISYTAPPFNTATDQQTTLLKLFETGSSPSFEWIYESNLKLKDSEDDRLHSAAYNDWRETAVSLYNTLKENAGDCINTPIKEHREVETGVYFTAYENGTGVYTNYNSKDVSVGGITLSARSYHVVQGGVS